MLRTDEERCGFALAALLHRDSRAALAIAGLKADVQTDTREWLDSIGATQDLKTRMAAAAVFLKPSLTGITIHDPRVARWFADDSKHGADADAPTLRRSFVPDEGVRRMLRSLLTEKP